MTKSQLPSDCFLTKSKVWPASENLSAIGCHALDLPELVKLG
jgi:hypothetical protein